MAYTVTISHEDLIDLLQNHYDDQVYAHIKEGDRITDIHLRAHLDIEITIGEQGEE